MYSSWPRRAARPANARTRGRLVQNQRTRTTTTKNTSRLLSHDSPRCTSRLVHPLDARATKISKSLDARAGGHELGLCTSRGQLGTPAEDFQPTTGRRPKIYFTINQNTHRFWMTQVGSTIKGWSELIIACQRSGNIMAPWHSEPNSYLLFHLA